MGDERTRIGVHPLPEVRNGRLELGDPVGHHPGAFVVADRSDHGSLVVGEALPERAELVLALPDHKPLASLGLHPDPLQQLGTALSGVRTEDGERSDIVLDLLPVPERQLARRRWRLLAAARRRGPSAYGERLTGSLSGTGLMRSLTAAWTGGRTYGSTRGERLPRMTDVRDGIGKFEPSAARCSRCSCCAPGLHTRRPRVPS
ncbi:hypothetical protein GCM10010260_81090 [Streptomyces filipinensis]|uniref:Uncharacterized protein n=1 Tax=Streptomyces filipinensis TaxID=66887 RepID=A0A918MGE5_9ACTN|nr:hypothetical protein [Streptomyces filipinensis]GGV28477.1 hypothetical protein GCM10010260_81090 [Streptomyces filipinensis]